MEYVSVRDFRTSPKAIWDSLRKDGKLVITNNGKPTAVMLGVNSGDLDETLASIRQAEAARLINKLRFDAMKSDDAGLSMDEIDLRISDIRKSVDE